MVAVSVLDREMYSEAEAARYLRMPQSTLHYWLEGGERRTTTPRRRCRSIQTCATGGRRSGHQHGGDR